MQIGAFLNSRRIFYVFMLKKLSIKNMSKTNGFTMTELVVTIALIGTLLSFAVPRYTTVTEEMQAERNIANMQVIRESFFHYFYRMHQQKGRVAHFPPQPTNETKVMDDTWADTPIDATLSPDKPKDLFATNELPKNANNNPFKYTTWEETPTVTTDQPVDTDGDGNQDVDENGELVFESVMVTGEKEYYIKIEDIDSDSPSYGKSFTYSI